MTAVTIPLTEERHAQLQDLAGRVGMSVEEFLRRRIEQMIDHPDEAFAEAAKYVLQKNAELYRRLS